MVERGRDYVLAAQVIGLSAPRIMFTHILPNAIGPVVVIAHHQYRPVDPGRGDAVLPRRGPAGDAAFAGHVDPCRQ
ncbi:MAG: ABC transporter permease subunit [Acetobacteraceae bacterium]